MKKRLSISNDVVIGKNDFIQTLPPLTFSNTTSICKHNKGNEPPYTHLEHIESDNDSTRDSDNRTISTISVSAAHKCKQSNKQNRYDVGRLKRKQESILEGTISYFEQKQITYKRANHTLNEQINIQLNKRTDEKSLKSLVKEETNAPIFNNITHPVSLQIGVATNCQIEGTKMTHQKNEQVQSVTHLPILLQTLGFQHGWSNNASILTINNSKCNIQNSVISHSITNPATRLSTSSTIIWERLNMHTARMCNSSRHWAESESKMDKVLSCDMRKRQKLEYQVSQ